MRAVQRESRKLLKRYILRYRHLWLWGFVAVVLTNIFTLIAPWVLKYAIDSISRGARTTDLLGYAGLIVGLAIFQGVFRYFMRQTMIVASRKVEYDLRQDFFAHLEKLDRAYYDRSQTGDIMARATNDVEAVRMMLGPGIMNFTNTIVAVVIGLVLMLSLHWRLTLYIFIPFPVLSLVTFLFVKLIYPRYERIQEQYSKISAKAQESLSGIRVIKAYVQEANERRAFRRLTKDYIKKNMDMIRIWGALFPVLSLLAGAMMVIVLLVGGRYVIAGSMTLGEFVAFTAYLGLLVWPMIALGWVMGLYQRGMASMGRIIKILQKKPLVEESPTPAQLPQIRGEIEFRNLSFSYPGTETTVLKNISLKIDAGQTVAIVGATGSGKTTMVSLISRVYPVERGQLFIDGVDINDISLKSLRRSVGFVPQETFLFSDTVRSNIAFGLETASDLEVIGVKARCAAIEKEILEFPEGYQTVLGERGITLSGGQKQRTAIARALMLNPPILILDDAFSSVDTYTEEEILNNFKNVFLGRTVIVISHRISTVRGADHIVVLERGEIAEQGTHDSLVSLGGLYSRIHEKQLLAEELEIIS
ncbi:MAG: ABC transporter ATP-binding protein [Candidatus Zixiibacteriota bacterium]|nr:MAG: ABC transporter ATP-binding protein [candidate division Zixibacteria bacterium]